MKNMRIKTKLLTAFILMACIAAVVGIVGIVGVRSTSDDAQRINIIGDNGIMVTSSLANINRQMSSYRTAAFKEYLGMPEDALGDLEEVSRLHEEFVSYLAIFKSDFITDQGVALITPIEEEYADFVLQRDALEAMIRSHQLNDDNMVPTLQALDVEVDQVAAAVENLKAYAIDTTTSVAGSTQREAWIMQLVMAVVMVVAVLAAILLGLYIARIISGPTGQLLRAAQKLSKGDINVQLSIDSRDELGELGQAFQEMSQGIQDQAKVLSRIAEGDYTMTVPVRSGQDMMNQAINHMIDSNNTIMEQIRNSSDQVASGSQQIAQAAQSLATGASEQSATIQEFTAAISEINAAAKDNTKTATETLGDVEHSSELMTECDGAMNRMLEAMQEINDSSQNISKVIKAIDDIAFQTNILALNAAVEAARAGQHGKGFAVVADEVRNLASKSADAAKETAGLIEQSLRSVTEGNDIVELVNNSIRGMGDITQKTALSVREMHTSSQNQSDRMTEVTEGIAQLSAVVEANSATAEETAASAEEMSAQSAVLNEIVLQFQLKRASGSPAEDWRDPAEEMRGFSSTGMALE